MLGPRDSVPHFEVTSIEGTPVRYATLWQRKNLLLITLPADTRAERCAYVTKLSAHIRELADLNTRVVITRDAVQGLDRPGVLVADRWGEICFAATAARASELPEPEDLVEWARYLQHQCPECQGEAR